jgi:hypothetical protein
MGELLSDFGRVAARIGGRPHDRRRMLPDNRWTFDVALVQGMTSSPLGRWTFGRHRGPEESLGKALHDLGHSGRLELAPVGWPGPDYSANLVAIYDDIEARRRALGGPDGRGDRGSDRDADGAMAG